MTESATTSALASDEVLDCVGLFCPNPIIQTSKRLKELTSGRVLEIVADDETFPNDIPDWCGKMGYEFLGVQTRGDEFHAFIRKP